MSTISVTIETPAGSGQKFAFDPVQGRMKLKKILPAGMVFPFDFGFLPGTRGGDEDPLDVLVLSELPIFPGCSVESRIIGAFVVEQAENENSSNLVRNDRFIAVPEASLVYAKVQTLGDLPRVLISQLETFFINYIEQEGKQIKVQKRISAVQALKVIEQFRDKSDKTLLFEIFVPLKNEEGTAFPENYFNELRLLLIEKFGGVTIHQRSPVTGVWENPESIHEQDELIVFEVMASHGNTDFWTKLKKKLEQQFDQDELLIRSSQVNTI